MQYVSKSNPGSCATFNNDKSVITDVLHEHILLGLSDKLTAGNITRLFEDVSYCVCMCPCCVTLSCLAIIHVAFEAV